MYGDALPRISEQVGYGAIGIGGSLGYDGKTVSVQRRGCSHALRMHPPARVRFALRGQFRTFDALVALNDDVAAGMSRADFVVLADDRETASAVYVVAGERPRRNSHSSTTVGDLRQR